MLILFQANKVIIKNHHKTISNKAFIIKLQKIVIKRKSSQQNLQYAIFIKKSAGTHANAFFIY